MLKIKPSKKKNTSSIVPVGTEEHGYLYLQKLGYLKSGEILEITKYQFSKKQSSGVLNTIIKSIAKDKEISREDASEYIFGKEINGARVFPKDQDIVLSEYEEELLELNKLEVPTLEIRNFVANILIKGFYVDKEFVPGRVAFQLELLEEVSVNDTKIKIEQLPFPLPDKTKIKFKDVILTVSGNHEAEVDELLIEKSPGGIYSGETGFLYDSVKKEYVYGNEEWSFSDTAQLPSEIIQAIYEFYESEANGGKEGKLTQTPLEEAKALTPVEEKGGEEEKRLTSTTATSKSKSTESKIPDLVAG